MLRLTTDDGVVYVNPNHVIYFAANEEDGQKWTEVYLTTEQILEVDESVDTILNLIAYNKKTGA